MLSVGYAAFWTMPCFVPLGPKRGAVISGRYIRVSRVVLRSISAGFFTEAKVAGSKSKRKVKVMIVGHSLGATETATDFHASNDLQLNVFKCFQTIWHLSQHYMTICLLKTRVRRSCRSELCSMSSSAIWPRWKWLLWSQWPRIRCLLFQNMWNLVDMSSWKASK